MYRLIHFILPFHKSDATRAGAARGNLLRTCFSYFCTQSKAHSERSER